MARLLVSITVVVAIALPANALADTGGASPGTGSAPAGGAQPQASAGPSVEARASIAADGRSATTPAGAPPAVRAAISAANGLTTKPYIWGGGHQGFRAPGYDCSGSVSYVLHAIGALRSPLVSGALAHWGEPGQGQWLTVFANRRHAFMMIAGLRFDTAGTGESGPRWRTDTRSYAGFARRHPAGL